MGGTKYQVKAKCDVTLHDNRHPFETSPVSDIINYIVGWLVGWLVSGAPTFMIRHHSFIHSLDLAPLIYSVLVPVSSAKVKASIGIANKVN